MDMSPACSPPIQPSINDKDRAHPLFPLWMQHRTFCNTKMIEASRFADFVSQHEDELRNRRFAADPQFPAFQAWMQANKGGARKCPAGVFPQNFVFWMEGGRW